MDKERDNFIEGEEDYETIFKNLREKYHLDDNKKQDDEPKEFYNPEKDTVIHEFFEESSKNSSERAEEFMDVDDDDDFSDKDIPISKKAPEEKVSNHDLKPEDFIWDENTVLDFGDKNFKTNNNTPKVFEDISSNTPFDLIENSEKISIEQIKQEQSIPAEETDFSQEDPPKIEESDEELPEEIVDEEIVEELPEDEEESFVFKKIEPEIEETVVQHEEKNGFSIKEDYSEMDDSEEIQFDFEDGEEMEENDYEEDENDKTLPHNVYPVVAENERGHINKDVTYDSINWDDFPTKKQQKKEIKELKKQDKKKKKRGLFPRKGDSAGEITRKIILIISILAIIGSSAWILNDLVLQPYLADRMNNNLSKTLVNTYTNEIVNKFEDLSESDKKLTTKELLAKNKEYVGWLTVSGADISLPVVKAEDNKKYLHRGFDGSYLYAGTLFVDSRNTSLFDQNVIIYGHNMSNGTMFGLLKRYKETDGKIYKSDPYITFHTIYGNFNYQIFGAYLADGDFDNDNKFLYNTITTNFSDVKFIEYMNAVKNKRYYKTEVEVSADDKILTLITCDRLNWKEGRLVIVAKKI